MKPTGNTRSLLPEEIEVRVDSISPNSFTLVCYVTARAAMNLLDDVYGPDKWSRRISIDKRSADSPLFATCELSVLLSDGTTIVREDVGEDKTSPKAAASDALKRAATNLIPSLRALYTLPTIRVQPGKLGISLSSSDNDARKKELTQAIRFKSFAVSSVSFATGTTGEFVSAIQIIDEDTGNPVAEYTSKRAQLQTYEAPALTELKKAMAEAGLTEEQVITTIARRYGNYDLETIANTPNLREDVYVRIEQQKEKTKKAKAAKTKSSGTPSVKDQLKGTA